MFRTIRPVTGLGWGLVALAALSLTAAKQAKPPGHAPTDAASIAQGAKLFTSFCVPCHGPRGRGDGPVGAALRPPPRNFTHPQDFKSKTDDEVFRVIQKGGAANKLNPAMPAWGPTIKPAQIWQLIAFVRSLAPKDSTPPPRDTTKAH